MPTRAIFDDNCCRERQLSIVKLSLTVRYEPGRIFGSAIAPKSSAVNVISYVRSKHFSSSSDVSGRNGGVPLCRLAWPCCSCNS
jgi:hypothetical protein